MLLAAGGLWAGGEQQRWPAHGPPGRAAAADAQRLAHPGSAGHGQPPREHDLQHSRKQCLEGETVWLKTRTEAVLGMREHPTLPGTRLVGTQDHFAWLLVLVAIELFVSTHASMRGVKVQVA